MIIAEMSKQDVESTTCDFSIKLLNEVFQDLFYNPISEERKRNVVLWVGKRGYKLIRRQVNGYSQYDPNICKIRKICRKVHSK